MAKTITDVRRKMELSHLEKQRNLLTKDVDLTSLSFITRNLPPLKFDEVVTGGEINRTIEGASTVTFTVNDDDGVIRKSGRLARAVDIKLDGLWFRLVKVQKSGWDITLTFESREISVLRTYNARRVVGWGKMRRSRFMQILVEEVKEFDIPFLCPDLLKPKKVKDKQEKAYKREPGLGIQQEFDPSAVNTISLTIKGKLATREQLNNVDQVLDVGNEMGANHRVLVSSIMTIITESRAYNIDFGDRDSVGLFQQRPSQGWKGLRNIAKASEEYFSRAMLFEGLHRTSALWEICQAVQRSGNPRAYAEWGNEATRLVTAYGITPDVNASNNMQVPEPGLDADKFQFTRGHPNSETGGKRDWSKENTWDCLQRLANEVNWRCFEVSGTIYFTTDKHLFKSAPRARLSEESNGVNWIDFDYDIGKPTSQVTIQAFVDRWEAPPGTIIEIFNMGPVNGRWLVTNIHRGIFDDLANITLKKPEARLPEPKKEDASSLIEAFAGSSTTEYVPTPGYDPDPPGALPKGAALRKAVLNNPQIKFLRKSQENDISFGWIDERVLRFMLNFVEAGFSIQVYALKTDHDPGTNHEAGRAIDISNYTDKTPGRTLAAMTWVRSHQLEFGPKLEFIGPIPGLCYPPGAYNTDTLNNHKNHLHVGWDA